MTESKKGERKNLGGSVVMVLDLEWFNGTTSALGFLELQ